jgi:hypothetical protein
VPYRVPDRQREPESPDIDENLLRKPWSSRALLISLVYAPLLTWWLLMVEGGSGPRQLTPSTKVAIAVAFSLWLVVLLVLRARHQRVVRTAVAKMEQQAARSSRVRIAAEPPGVREVDDVEPEDESEARRQAQRRR